MKNPQLNPKGKHSVIVKFPPGSTIRWNNEDGLYSGMVIGHFEDGRVYVKNSSMKMAMSISLNDIIHEDLE